MAVSVDKFYLQFHLQTAKLWGEIMQDLSQGGTLKLKNHIKRAIKKQSYCHTLSTVGEIVSEKYISEVRIAFRIANIVT